MYMKKSFRRKPRTYKRKRGFGLDVSLGKNVPFFGGSSMKLGTRGVKRMIKREINKQEETKIVQLNNTLNGATCNTFYTYAPVQYVASGTDDSNRIGRKVFLRHLKVKGCITTNGTIPVEVRWLALWLPANKAYTIGAGGYSHLPVGINSSDIFYAAANQVNALINNKLGAQVICDKKFKVSNLVAGQAACKEYTFDCPIMENVQYANSTAPSLFNGRNLYLLRIITGVGLASGLSTGTTDEHNVVMTFKDA